MLHLGINLQPLGIGEVADLCLAAEGYAERLTGMMLHDEDEVTLYLVEERFDVLAEGGQNLLLDNLFFEVVCRPQ